MAVEQPAPACWLDPRVVVRDSTIEGRGLFASAPLAVGNVVARLGGSLVTTDDLRGLFEDAAAERPPRYIDTITVGDDEHLVLTAGEQLHFLNHSCDPNTWHDGTFTIVVRRAVAEGDELTIDYATHSGLADFRMPCACGAPRCRGVVTGDDWRLPDLQHRYGAHWVRGLRARIAAS